MPTNLMQSMLTLNATLTAAASSGSGLGRLVVVCPEGASPLVNEYTTVADAAAATALLTATNITAAGNLQLQAAYGQDFTPGTVVVATYDDATEDPTDALDRLDAAEIPYGVIVPATVDATDLAALGTWFGTHARKNQMVVICESRHADLITGTPPSALDALMVRGIRLLYGASSQGLAGAYAGRFVGRGLAVGPAAARVRIAGVALSGETSAELQFAIDNNVGVLLPLDAGSGASEYFLRGEKDYAGNDWKSVCSLHYAVTVIRAFLKALIANKAIEGAPLEASVVGLGEAIGAVSEPLATMAANGHFSPGVSGTAPNLIRLPEGYDVDGEVDSPDLNITVRMRLGAEVESITVNNYGEVV